MADHDRRGFSITHQKISLALTFDGSLKGEVDISLLPSSTSLKTIYLNARQMKISSIYLITSSSPQKLEYSYSDPLLRMASICTDIHTHPAMKRALCVALSEGQEGELGVALPDQIEVSLGSEIGIRIMYELQDPVEAVKFVKPCSAFPNLIPHIFTSATCPDFARCWVPCVDSPLEKCTWDISFTVPKLLRSSQSADFVVVACSGEPQPKAQSPTDPARVVFSFLQASPVSVQMIAWAAGPFHQIMLSDAGTVPSITALCLPGLEKDLRLATAFLPKAMAHFSSECGSYPFTSFSILFLDDLPTPTHLSATLAFMTTDLLHSSDVIEPAYETRQVLSHSLVHQWMGVNISAKTPSDIWLVNGLALYLAGHFLRSNLGNNEYRFRLKKDIDRCVAWDQGSQRPICIPGALSPPDAAALPFINLKSPLVLHALDKRLCKGGTSLGLNRIVPKIFLSALTGEMTNNLFSTASFLKTCRKVSGVDVKGFADQWIYGSGCPKFSITANFNRKRMAVEMQVRQENRAINIAPSDFKPVSLFEGTMTIRIHEADGTPYEHVIDIREPFRKYDVPFNTKYKRVRRFAKRYQMRQTTAALAAQGDKDAAEDLQLMDSGFDLSSWQDERERERWRVGDWTETDETVMASATYEWIRVDADVEWIASIWFDQPQVMWASQLERDRDVVAQVQALHAIAGSPSLMTSTILTRTALITNYCYLLRMEAVVGLIGCATPRLENIGLFHLLKIFQTRYCHSPRSESFIPEEMDCVPKPNDFSNFAEYFIKKTLITTLSHVRDQDGTVPHLVKQFLVNILRYNDNTRNQYSDSIYIASIITAMGHAFMDLSRSSELHQLSSSNLDTTSRYLAKELFKQSEQEVDRYLRKDWLVPSYQNVITVSGLEWKMKMMLAGLIPKDVALFLAYTREGNYGPIRSIAFDAVMLLRGLSIEKLKPLNKYIFHVIQHDSSRTIRRRLSQSLVESLLIHAASGEYDLRPGQDSNFTLDDDVLNGNVHKSHTKTSSSQQLHKIGKQASVRDGILAVLSSRTVDYYIRWCLLHVAELTARPTAETPPAMTLKVHTLSLPTAKLALSDDDNEVYAEDEIGAAEPLPESRPAIKLSLPSRKKDLTVKLDRRKKAAPRAQGSGMSGNDLKACRGVLRKLLGDKRWALFSTAVDPIRDHAPNYFEIIKNPMDLGTINVKLESGSYKDRFEMELDFRRIIGNARTYNAEGTFVYNEATALEAAFQRLWDRTNNTLEKMQSRTTHLEDNVSSLFQSSVRQFPTFNLADLPDSPPKDDHLSLPANSNVIHIVDDNSEEDSAVLPIRHHSLRVKMKPSEHSSQGDDLDAEPLSKVSTAHVISTPKVGAPPRISIKLKSNPLPELQAQLSDSVTTPASQPLPKKVSPTALSENGSSSDHSVTFVPSENVDVGPVLNEKKCKSLLSKLMSMREAFFFLHPVDPIRDQCPTYLDEISHPMDFETISRKLSRHKYQTLESFSSDVQLIFDNCRRFNGPGELSELANIVERVFASGIRNQSMSRAKTVALPSKQTPGFSECDKTSARSLIKKMFSHPDGHWFSIAVDPIAFGIPNYFKVIGKQNARDLSLIRDKLADNMYSSLDEITADIRLMVQNAIKFNGENTVVGVAGMRLQADFERGVADIKRKRKDVGSNGGSVSKKLKLTVTG